MGLSWRRRQLWNYHGVRVQTAPAGRCDSGSVRVPHGQCAQTQSAGCRLLPIRSGFRLLTPVPSLIALCLLSVLQRKFTDVQLLLQEWRDYNRDAPREISCMAVLACGGPVVLPGAYVGDDCAVEGKRMIAELTKIGRPLINTYSVTPYCDGKKIGAALQCSAVEHQPSDTQTLSHA